MAITVPRRTYSAERAAAGSGGSRVPLLILKPRRPAKNRPAVLWMHGGGYLLGMKEMVYLSRASDLAEKYGAVVVSPGYRRSIMRPYPAAIEDCFSALLWLRDNCLRLGCREDQIMVGGESAGGGLTAALCMMAKDSGRVNIAYQMPLYPMLDCFDTETSADNHGKMWNTRLNHFGWNLYLRGDAGGGVSSYASPSRRDDYSGLPPCYTFVGDGEPFYAETLRYAAALRGAGTEVSVDVYHTDIHAFDIVKPRLEISVEARQRFNARFEYALERYFAPQPQRA